jgi:Ca2+-binding RTX toxin-like protein
MGGQVSAFAGAEGYGADASGGRGGQVLHVTTLADSGDGSLRWALMQTGPRTIVFDISGSIKLDSQILVRNGDVTIAGQTAPGEGITIEGSRIRFKAGNIIVRGMHFRPGDGGGMDPGDRDGAMIGTTDFAMTDIMIDHNSFTWGVDENLSVNGNVHNVTISNNIIAEGLSHSIHPEGEHSKGLLISNWGSTQSDYNSNITITKNLLADNVERNPEVHAGQNIEITNNLIYNYGVEHHVIHVGGGSGGALEISAKVVGNVIVPGPNSDRHLSPIAIAGMGAGSVVTVADNLWSRLATDSAGNQDQSQLYWDDGGAAYVTNTASFGSGMTVLDSKDVTAYVLAHAGTSGFSTNSVDARIIRDVVTGGGQVIDSTAQVGGMPSASGAPSMAGPVDTDRDGMPDWFETKYGFDAAAFDANGDSDGDGFTNIEEYINGIISGFDLPEVRPDLSQEDALPVSTGGPTLMGTAGNDTFTVRTLGSVLAEAEGGGIDMAVSYVDFRLSDNVENLCLKGNQAQYGTGNDLANKITGTDFDNRLAGLAGDDLLRGMKGNDRLNGGLGNDRLEGNEGDDILMGGAGDDALYGGTGNDVFRFVAGDANLGTKGPGDVIMDFDVGDRLMLPRDTLVDVRTMNSVTTSGKTYVQALAAAQASFASFGNGPLLVKGASDSFVFWSDGDAGTLNQGVMLKGLSAAGLARLG